MSLAGVSTVPTDSQQNRGAASVGDAPTCVVHQAAARLLGGFLVLIASYDDDFIGDLRSLF